MATAISRFRSGHRSANRLLDVLTQQLSAFEQGHTPDMLLVRDIVDCLNRYAAVGCDAFEAALIDDLTRADSHFAPARLVLTTEHSVIGELGRHCLECIGDIIDGAVLPRAELLTPARRYLRMYRNHLRRERLYLLRHERGSIDRQERISQPPPSGEPLGDYPDLRDRITRATARRSLDETGEPICPACAVDAAFAVERTPVNRSLTRD